MAIDFTALFIIIMVIVGFTALTISALSYILFKALRNLAKKFNENDNYFSGTCAHSHT